MTNKLHLPLLIIFCTLLNGCAGFSPGYETPSVTVSSFRALPSERGLPSFEIGLHVVNPNALDLKLRGISYTVNLAGHDLIKGVGNNLPVVKAYGEETLTLTASADLIAGLQLLGDLMKSGRNDLPYALEARLDVGGLWPALRVTDKGSLSLNDLRN